MKKVFILLAFFVLTVFNLRAQDVDVVAVEVEETPDFTISGSIDTYFRTSLNTADNGTFAAPATSFANQTGFGLGMANVIFSYEGEKAGFVADLVFGPRGADAVFGSQIDLGGLLISGNSTIVNQLYAYWAPSDAVTLTLGNFNTFLGYEVISPVGNFHYSTSYMFSYGPFSHTGLKLDFDLGGGLSLMGAIMNPTDATEYNPFDDYTLGFQLGHESETGGTWINAQLGDQDGDEFNESDEEIATSLFQIDLTSGYNLSETFYLGLNTSYQVTGTEVEGVDPGSFFGVALYPSLTVSDAFGIGLRGEYFSVSNGYLSDEAFPLDNEGNGSVIAFTLSTNHTIGNLRFIPEVRADLFSNDFTDDGDTKSSMLSFLLAAVYSF